MRRPGAFTLIELLVVISIIALLIGILLPALGAARVTARSAASLSNLRQIGIALANYNAEREGFFPIHSSGGPTVTAGGVSTKPRWADYLFQYLSQNTEVYRSPNLTAREEADFLKVFFFEVSDTPAEWAAYANAAPARSATVNDPPAVHGGYGYNFQYLGNARNGVKFNRNLNDITRPSEMVSVGDVAGSRGGSAGNEPGAGGEAVYSLDPPRASARGANNAGAAYYAGGSSENTGAYDADHVWLWRSFPAERNKDWANIGFVDGHVEAKRAAEIDDYDGDGVSDNGYWNGWGDPGRY